MDFQEEMDSLVLKGNLAHKEEEEARETLAFQEKQEDLENQEIQVNRLKYFETFSKTKNQMQNVT